MDIFSQSIPREGKMAIVVCVILAILTGIIFNTGCNREMLDINFRFNKAMIKMPDGTCKTVKVRSWRDFQDGDQIQVTDTNGKVYLGHSCNIMLLSE